MDDDEARRGVRQDEHEEISRTFELLRLAPPPVATEIAQAIYFRDDKAEQALQTAVFFLFAKGDSDRVFSDCCCDPLGDVKRLL